MKGCAHPSNDVSLLATVNIDVFAICKIRHLSTGDTAIRDESSVERGSNGTKFEIELALALMSPCERTLKDAQE